MMLFVPLVLAAAATPTPAIGPVLASPAFDAFVHQADRQCPARKVRLITPGDLSWEQEGFEARLSRPAQSRLAAADASKVRCAKREGGLSCDVTATLEALEHTRMMGQFASFVCAHVPPA